MIESSSQTTVLFILGMHRSGTSAVAGAFARLGFHLGDHLLKASPANPKGYFENTALVRMHDLFLNGMGYAWNDPRPFPPAWQNSALAKQFQESLGLFLQQSFPADPWIAVKDPRICRLLPLWLPVLQALGWQAQVVLVRRHPEAIAASLQRRDGMAPTLADLLYIRYWLEAEMASRTLPRSTLDYDRFLEGWETELQRLISDFSWNHISLNRARHALRGNLDASLRHHRPSGQMATPFAPLTTDIYQALIELSNPESQATWSRVAAQMELLQQQFLLQQVRNISAKSRFHETVKES